MPDNISGAGHDPEWNAKKSSSHDEDAFESRVQADSSRTRMVREGYATQSSRNGGAGHWLSAILGHDPATRKLMGSALALVAVLLMIVGGWSLFGHRQQGIPIIAPPALPLKNHPADPGGMQIMSDDSVSSDVTGKGELHLAPPPEQPDMRVLARQERQHDTIVQDQSTVDSSALSIPSPPVASPSSPSIRQTKPEVVPSARPIPQSQSERLPSPSVGHGDYEVQLAALDSDAQARKEWDRLLARASSLLSGKTPFYRHIERNGRNFVRLRLGGFEDLRAARLFCAKLHARSIACAPAAF